MAAASSLQGDPKSIDDLRRAGAERASNALLLGGPNHEGLHSSALKDAAVADAEVIFAFQHLKTLNRNLEVYSQVRPEDACQLPGSFLPPSASSLTAFASFCQVSASSTLTFVAKMASAHMQGSASSAAPVVCVVGGRTQPHS